MQEENRESVRHEQRENDNAEVNLQTNPLGPSYPESAARHIGYRIGIVVIAMIGISFGKSNLPSDGVQCIEDSVIDGMIPITNYYIAHPAFGKMLTLLLELCVDVGLVGMAVLWFIKGTDLVFPVSVSLVGIMKIFLTIIFKVRQVKPSFSSPVLPSFVLAPNLASCYFFSASCSFLVISMLELRRIYAESPHSIERNIWKCLILVIAYCSFILLSMRLNFIADVATGLVLGHLLYQKVLKRKDGLQQIALTLYDKVAGQGQDEEGRQQNKQYELKEISLSPRSCPQPAAHQN